MAKQGGCPVPGTVRGLAIVFRAMAVNPDPKPGRWILPLVILGMIAFTYFFVRELPEASTETTLISGDDTTTTTTPADGSTSTTDGSSDLDPETQAYLDEIDAINNELQVQSGELTAANTGFDADPREVTFDEAVARFQGVIDATTTLNERLNSATVPAALETNHANLQTTLSLAEDAAREALSGLQSTDDGSLRRSAVETYATAATDFDTEVTNTRNAAGA